RTSDVPRRRPVVGRVEVGRGTVRSAGLCHVPMMDQERQHTSRQNDTGFVPCLFDARTPTAEYEPGATGVPELSMPSQVSVHVLHSRGFHVSVPCVRANAFPCDHCHTTDLSRLTVKS